MKRAERLYALVDLLRAARAPMSAARLSREFGVSTRTIERDIQSLQLSGVPIYADLGAAGGYSILREYSLPPLNLSASESLAVLAGLGLVETSPFGAAARRARAKVLAVVAEDDRGTLDDALSTLHVIDRAPTVTSSPDAPLELLADAIVDRRVVRLDYVSLDVSLEGGTPTSRTVETMGLLRGADTWMLVGWCRLGQGIRGFRLERITRLEITDEVALPRDPSLLEADLARWSTRALGSDRGAQR
jgi:predicted DNA-binding transcriptional regulator YafY